MSTARTLVEALWNVRHDVEVANVLAMHGYEGPTAYVRARQAIVHEFAYSPVDSPDFVRSASAMLILSNGDSTPSHSPRNHSTEMPPPPRKARKSPKRPRTNVTPLAIVFD
jgi:hypothetical protein